ncbi:MAG TPA: PTS sugar transporter subunit IIA [Planctomycetota bacterium]|nr:PTS sugar transporter subunit IIA [Planctomycetota bacterium]
MNVLRFLHPDCIALDLDLAPTPPGDDESDAQLRRRRERDKESALERFADLLDLSGAIANPTKLFKDMRQRETQGSTAIAPGLAIPHARSMQARRFVIGFVRATPPVWFDSADGSDTRLFFLLAAPPYDDAVYLKVLRDFAEMMQNEWVGDALIAAKDAHEVMSVLRGYVTK